MKKLDWMNLVGVVEVDDSLIALTMLEQADLYPLLLPSSKREGDLSID